MGTLVGLGNSATASDSVGLQEKERKLFRILEGLGQVLVAYSGGTDSAYLAWAAGRVLGDKAVAITADSASMPESHKRDAEDFARRYGLRHEYIKTFEFDNPVFAANNADRCFHCKDELFSRLEQVGRERGVANIVYGVNVDDLGDYRPGQNAASKHEVRAPLMEAGMTKADIRELSHQAGLPTLDLHGDLQATGIPIRHPRSGGLQDGLIQREAEEEIGARGGGRAHFTSIGVGARRLLLLRGGRRASTAHPA